MIGLIAASLLLASGVEATWEAKPGLKSPLPTVTRPLPRWMNSVGEDALFQKPARHNQAIERLPAFAADMYGTGVGHAMAYEALATGKHAELESKVFDRIVRVLKRPPTKPIDESSISPTFYRRYGFLEKVFDWAHTLHFQTIDVLSDPHMNDADKDREIERIWQFYQRQPVALTGLPLNMEVLDSYPFSGAFRTQFPKVNGLFWGYHWLQTVNYDMLYRVPTRDHAAQYEVIGERYRSTELLKTDRDFMPMTAELSPRFAKRFPEIANAFDNLHMLHDNVNDILADPRLDRPSQRTQIQLAIARVLASTHRGKAAGEGEPLTLNDHRFPFGMPGMGMMLGSDESTMYMSGMGWMDMSVCAHCSIPLPAEGPWGATVTANGWTMTVRCLMCARDMASETPGRVIIRAATEDPNRILVLISDEEGNWKSNILGVTFLEDFAEHPDCDLWSRAFTSAEALKSYVRENPSYAKTPPLDLTEWSALNRGRPATYRKLDRENPYRKAPSQKVPACH